MRTTLVNFLLIQVTFATVPIYLCKKKIVCDSCAPIPGGYPPTFRWETFYDDEPHPAIVCDNIAIPAYYPPHNLTKVINNAAGDDGVSGIAEGNDKECTKSGTAGQRCHATGNKTNSVTGYKNINSGDATGAKTSAETKGTDSKTSGILPTKGASHGLIPIMMAILVGVSL